MHEPEAKLKAAAKPGACPKAKTLAQVARTATKAKAKKALSKTSGKGKAVKAEDPEQSGEGQPSPPPSAGKKVGKGKPGKHVKAKAKAKVGKVKGVQKDGGLAKDKSKSKTYEKCGPCLICLKKPQDCLCQSAYLLTLCVQRVLAACGLDTVNVLF